MILGIILSAIITPLYQRNSELDLETIQLLPAIEGNFIMLENPTSYSRAYYSFAPIYYNKTTISGWLDQAIKEEDVKRIYGLNHKFRALDCKEFIAEAKILNVGSVITYNEYCGKMEACTNAKIKTEHSCLFVI